MKMTVIDQIKILDRKIKQNEVQYNIDRKATKISALSSINLDKYEYLTGEDLGIKPSTVEQAKSEYSPLGKVFNKGLNEGDNKEGLLKRLKNIKDKNEELLNAFIKANKASKAAKIKVNNKNKNFVYNSQHSFVKFKNINEFKGFSYESAYKKLENFLKKFMDLKNVTPRSQDNKNLKEKVLNNAGNLLNDLYYIYKDKYSKKISNLNTEDKEKFSYTNLRLTDDYKYYSEENEEKQQTNKNFNELNELITRKKADINNELVKKYFYVQDLKYLLKNL